MANPKFVISKAANGEYKFVLKAGNGEIIAQSETYKAKASAENGIESIRKNAPIAEIVDETV
ncbi:MAG: YegP family protein [Microbacteriaceae bacterium]|nr:YegP family protein [Microbacteriaceae bacterium]